jgi:DNA polymerase-3 subunit delta'
MIDHPKQWTQIQSALVNQRIAQSMLFVGPLHCSLVDFVTKVMQLLVCKQSSNSPCYECIDCRMTQRIEHPDLEWIKPEKSGGAIKVDQIRELQNTAYLTPQRAGNKLIVIEAADRMNTASANALLKILEEPAKHTIFILIAQQLGTVLPTIISRCQIITFSSSAESYNKNLLMLGDYYPVDSERALIVGQAELILDGVIALLEGKEHPCTIAAHWGKFELGNILWFLYLVYSQLQNMYIDRSVSVGPATHQLAKLLTLLNPLLIFKQIDKINTLLRKLSHNIHVANILVLEDLLLSLAPRI